MGFLILGLNFENFAQKVSKKCFFGKNWHFWSKISKIKALIKCEIDDCNQKCSEKDVVYENCMLLNHTVHWTSQWPRSCACPLVVKGSLSSLAQKGTFPNVTLITDKVLYKNLIKVIQSKIWCTVSKWRPNNWTIFWRQKFPAKMGNSLSWKKKITKSWLIMKVQSNW